MVDVAFCGTSWKKNRCERPDCGRLAVGAHANASAKATSLCTLHARTDRVDVEGMAFVLLMLSKARHTRRRYVAWTSVLGSTGGVRDTNFTTSCCDVGRGKEALCLSERLVGDFLAALLMPKCW